MAIIYLSDRRMCVTYVYISYVYFGHVTFEFYINVERIEYTFRIYILLHAKKHYFIHFIACF